MSFDILLSILCLSYPGGWDNKLLIRKDLSYLIAGDLSLDSGLY